MEKLACASETSLALVVPCFNEEARLPVDRYENFLQRNARTWLLFVDDGSTDGTGRLLERMSERHPDTIKTLRLRSNRGKGEAVRRGVLHALNSEPDYFGYWDADLATPLDAISHFTDILDHNEYVDIVMGARVKLLGREIRRRAVRHYPGRVFATFASMILGIGVYDTQCGAKIFRNVEPTRRAFERPFRSRWIFDVELLARYLCRKDREEVGNARDSSIYELPLERWIDVRGSKTRPRDFIAAAWELVRIWHHYFGPGREAQT